MNIDTPAAFTPEDLRKNFERLQADLNIVQNELDQALDVWRSILASEKLEFKEIIEGHARTWDREETQWQKDRQAYEQKIQELEAYFHRQLSTTEKNAVTALNELDAAWQQERLRWQQTASQQSEESRQNHEQLEQRVAQLAEENTHLQSQPTGLAAPEPIPNDRRRHPPATIVSGDPQAPDWQTDKVTWPTSPEEYLVAERQQKEVLVQSLQHELASLDRRLRASEQVKKLQEQQLETYVTNLEKQIVSLNEFIQQLMPTAHPFRRQTDRLVQSPTGNTLPVSRASN